MLGDLLMTGNVVATKNMQAPLSWRIRNTLRWGYIWGWFTTWLAYHFSKITGVPTITSDLVVRLHHAGLIIDYGVVSRRVVTDTGVGFIVDAWDNDVELEDMNYHGCGTGAGAEAANQTALVTESTTALNPDSTRATGTMAQPAANQLRTTGTLTFDAGAAIIEHGLLSQAATGGGVLFDRSLFAEINVVSGDSITFQYTATFNAGG